MIVSTSVRAEFERRSARADALPPSPILSFVSLLCRAQGTIVTGRHLRYTKDTPLCNLFLSMLDRVGVQEERFGDSTGRVGQLTS